MSIGQKIADIRKAEGVSIADLEALTGIPISTLEGIEELAISPGPREITAFCGAFHHYSQWLTSETIDPDSGQISPHDFTVVSAWLSERGMYLPKHRVIALVSEVSALIDESGAPDPS